MYVGLYYFSIHLGSVWPKVYGRNILIKISSVHYISCLQGKHRVINHLWVLPPPHKKKYLWGSILESLLSLLFVFLTILYGYHFPVTTTSRSYWCLRHNWYWNITGKLSWQHISSSSFYLLLLSNIVHTFIWFWSPVLGFVPSSLESLMGICAVSQSFRWIDTWPFHASHVRSSVSFGCISFQQWNTYLLLRSTKVGLLTSFSSGMSIIGVLIWKMELAP